MKEIPLPKNLCYDQVVESIRREYEEIKRDITSYPQPAHILPVAINSLESHEAELRFLEESKVFWIDNLTQESLMNEPHEKLEMVYTPNFPFKGIFFDLEESISYNLIKSRKKPIGNVGGIQLTNFGIQDEPNGFLCRAFRNDGNDFFATIFYRLINNDALIQESSFEGDNVRHYILRNDTLFWGRERLSDLEIACVNLEDFLKETDKYFDLESLDYKMEDDDNLDAFKLVNFSMNLIEYINAQNVTLHEKRRKRKDVVRVGKGKDRKIQPIEIELKPYYWVDIQKGEYDSKDRDDFGGWTIDYRVWVRGHFHRYHTKEGLVSYWIDPYVKGPEGAPWKHNRYRVLYSKFKDVLRHPRPESD